MTDPVSDPHRTPDAEAIAQGHVTAVHINMDPEQTRKIQERWHKWGGETPLVVLESLALGTPVVTARADDSQAVIQAGPFTWRAAGLEANGSGAAAGI